MLDRENKLAKILVRGMHYLSRKGFLYWISDEIYLRIVYRLDFGKKLNLDDPKTFNEKLQWLKLYDRKPEYTTMVDKYAVKKWVADKIGEEYVIPLLGVWDRTEDIDFDALPNQFVLKCNHDSGGLVICKDKETFDRKAAIKKLRKAFKNNGYGYGREWPYKDVPKKIIAEKYMEDKETAELRDYKFYTFSGKAKVLLVVTDRQKSETETKFDFFDIEYNHLNIRHGHPNAENIPQKPVRFEEMRILAEKLSNSIPHLRIDFYEVNGRVYFGEFTFFPCSGRMSFEPEECNYTFGSWIELPNK